MNRRCTVYGLIAGDEHFIRYIGQTVQKPQNRLRYHLYAARKHNRTAVQRWISAAVRRGAVVRMEVLEANAEWHAAEKRIIAFHRELGASLLNLTDGGEGTLGFTYVGPKKPWLSERNRQRSGAPGRKLTQGEIDRLVKYSRGAKRPYTAERNRARAGMPGHKHTDEHKIYMSQLLKGHEVSPETRAKIGAANKGRVRTEEARQRMREAQLRRQAALRAIGGHVDLRA